VVKAELNDKINYLMAFKKDVIASQQVEISAKSRLRITIESFLIDLNEEIFALSEELARSLSEDSGPAPIVSKAREFDVRKRAILKKVEQTLANDPIAKIVKREFRISAESKSRSGSRQTPSRSRSRTKSQEKKSKHYPLRNIQNYKQFENVLGSGCHSPPERDDLGLMGQ
jgi:hypothetical protein